MNFLDLLRQYLKKGVEGVLSVKLQNQSHLLKIYIEGGDIVYVTLGNFKNEECFSQLKDALIVEHFFLTGIKPPQKIGGCTEKLIEALGLPSIDALRPKAGIMVPAQDVERLEKEFIDIIGPIGKLIIDEFYLKMGYSRGNPMSEDEYIKVVESLSKELPASEQGRFSAKLKER